MVRDLCPSLLGCECLSWSPVKSHGQVICAWASYGPGVQHPPELAAHNRENREGEGGGGAHQGSIHTACQLLLLLLHTQQLYTLYLPMLILSHSHLYVLTCTDATLTFD